MFYLLLARLLSIYGSIYDWLASKISPEEVSLGRDQRRFASMERIESVVTGLVRMVETRVIKERHKPPNSKSGSGMIVAKRFYNKN